MTHPPARIVIISDFANVRGGASGLALRQAELMAQRSFEVVLIAGDSHRDAPDGVMLVSLGGERLLETGRLKAATRGLWDPSVKAAVQTWIEENDDPSTIYHLHGFQQTLSPAVLSALKPVEERLVIHAHDYFLACPNGAFFDYRANRTCGVRAMSAACISSNCDKNSRAQKIWRVTRQALQNRAFSAIAPKATVILPKSGMNARLGLTGNTVVLANPAEGFPIKCLNPAANDTAIYVGDLNPYKGVLLFAEAARRANATAVFIGDGAKRETIAKTWPEHRITGWRDRDGIAAELAKARVVIAPSLGPEPFGLAPVEALLSGIPVIVADAMLIADDVVSGGAGISFEAGSISSLETVLGRAMRDDDLIGSLTKKSVETGRAVSSTIQDWIDALLELYGKILSRQPLPQTEFLTAAE